MWKPTDRMESVDINGTKYTVKTKMLDHYLASYIPVYAVDSYAEYLQLQEANKLSDVTDYMPVAVSPIPENLSHAQVIFPHNHNVRQYLVEMQKRLTKDLPIITPDNFKVVFEEEVDFYAASVKHLNNPLSLIKILENPCLRKMDELERDEPAHITYWKNMHFFEVDSKDQNYGLRLQFNDHYDAITEIAILYHKHSFNRNNHYVLATASESTLECINAIFKDFKKFQSLKEFFILQNSRYAVHDTSHTPF